jgi:hypothetical protein
MDHTQADALVIACTKPTTIHAQLPQGNSAIVQQGISKLFLWYCRPAIDLTGATVQASSSDNTPYLIPSASA